MDDTSRAWRIHSLIERGGSIEEVRRLIEETVNKQALFSPYIPLMYHAVARNRTDIVRLLIESGANVNQETDGIPPLHEAVRFGRVDIVELLIEKGADVNQRRFYFNDTPLDRALESLKAPWGAVRAADYERIIFLLTRAGGVPSNPKEETLETIEAIIRKLASKRRMHLLAARQRFIDGRNNEAAAPATGGAGAAAAPAPRKQQGGSRRRRISRRRKISRRRS